MIEILERILNLLEKKTTQELVDFELLNLSEAIAQAHSDDLNHREIKRIVELFQIIQVAINKKGLDESKLLQVWNTFDEFTIED